MFAFRLGKATGFLAIVVVGLGIWAYSAVDNLLHYAEVQAVVDRVDEVCAPYDEPPETAIDCSHAESLSAGKKLSHYRAVSVRYQSPADSKPHTGVVVPRGGAMAVEAIKLQPGDRWKVLARKDNPEVIKSE